MKDGLRVFDADTHVEPTAEVIDTYVDPGYTTVAPAVSAAPSPGRYLGIEEEAVIDSAGPGMRVVQVLPGSPADRIEDQIDPYATR